MRLNNKGFAISTILYSLLVMATLVLFLLIGNFSFERRSTNDFVSDIEDDLNNFAEGAESESGEESGETGGGTTDSGETPPSGAIRVPTSSDGEMYLKYSDGSYVRGGDIFRIVNPSRVSYVLSLQNNNVSLRSNTIINTYSNGVGQRFRLRYSTTSPYYYMVSSVAPDFVIGNRTSARNEPIILYNIADTNGLKWTFIKNDNDNNYVIRSIYGQCMTRLNNNIGSRVVSYTCNNDATQSWTLIKIS